MTQPSPSIEYLQHPNMYIHREVPGGKRLVILAQSDEGPLYEPVLVYHKDMATSFFGGGDLVRLYEDSSAFQKGLHVYLMRMEDSDYDQAFSVLESFPFDLIFIDEMRFGQNESLMNRFFHLCHVKEEKGSLIHGITTLKEKSYEEISSLFQKIDELTQDFANETREMGKYLSLVVNQMEFHDAGAVYAGMLTVLEPEVSPINKTIPGVSLTYEFSKQEIFSLRSAGVVCFKSTFKRGITCTSSSCAVSTEGSVHKHISNFRIAQYLINEISLGVQQFIGQPSPMFQAMNTEDVVDATCMSYVHLNRIRDYGYSVRVNEPKGYVDLEIEIIPVFSVYSMTTHSRVRVFK